jgi:hypothetical protein
VQWGHSGAAGSVAIPAISPWPWQGISALTVLSSCGASSGIDWVNQGNNTSQPASNQRTKKRRR